MLVITSRKDQAIRIGNIVVLISDVRSSGRVRVGIEAPRHVPIVRCDSLDEALAEVRGGLVTEPAEVVPACAAGGGAHGDEQ